MVDCCSEKVEIIFLALHSTISDIGAKASLRQGRNVKNHIIDIVRCDLYFLHVVIFVLFSKNDLPS